MNREFWKYFFSAVGTISSVVTLISFVFQWKNPSCYIVVLYVIGIIMLSTLFAVWQTWKKTKLTLKISNNLTLNVGAGDLFSFAKENNFVVIPVNEYFDTIVDSKIINSGSVHGQFISKYYADNHRLLHEETERNLRESGIAGVMTERPNSEGYTIKYPLGTCATIKKDGTNFVLLALTHFDENDKAFVELSEFGRCISYLCHYLNCHAGKQPVYMPLMGMGLARLNQPTQFILKYTIDTIIGVKNLALLGGLNIVIYPPVAKTVNLNEIKY